MVPFKPAEIRIIAFLSFLALLGSALAMVQNHRKAQRLSLAILSDKSEYKYVYRIEDLNRVEDTALAMTLASQAPIAVAEPLKIDLNSAGLFEFEALPGIGPAIAQGIITHRDSIGRFERIEDILKVKGVGPAKFAAIKEMIFIK